ncbi:hypothetical protein KUL25_06140 [Rhodobacteraceae bacterium N5(2021)]|uniref:Uncharacterized protein n=1 Tax=Gymnodinialimonas phycosphaerae TaxID=2841589 RepID=A0A975YH65_9RHOB|nr:hypothetical protein [Gymnodinialimonas phycosphaerae]MBY4892341.1 hypothetical protein [Gymnodinialimonas phycosphaerae]
MLDMWPFFLLIAVFVGFSIYMARTMGSGKEGSYAALMRRQNELMEAQVTLLADHLTEARRLANALEGLAKKDAHP